jgi:hypothetical protein
MFRRHWREPAFWRWWWGNQAPHGAKVFLAGLALLGFLGIGFLAAVGLSRADTGSVGKRGLTLETTVNRLVTVREHGRVVIRRVPVVRRVVYRPQTAFRTLIGTRLITTRGQVRYVPVVKKRVVTVDGRTNTITETRLVPTTRTKTQTQTRTQTQTKTQTEVQTQTTVVTDQETIVHTETLPVTVRETVVQTVTTTVTVPAVTVTITVPTGP